MHRYYYSWSWPMVSPHWPEAWAFNPDVFKAWRERILNSCFCPERGCSLSNPLHPDPHSHASSYSETSWCLAFLVAEARRTVQTLLKAQKRLWARVTCRAMAESGLTVGEAVQVGWEAMVAWPLFLPHPLGILACMQAPTPLLRTYRKSLLLLCGLMQAL